LLCIATEVWGRTKIDPFLGTVSRAKAFKTLSLNAAPPASKETEVFIKTSDPELTTASVVAAGGKVRANVGDIITASVPLGAIAEIAEGTEVVFVEAAKPIGRSADVAGEEIGVSEVHLGTGLPQGFTGSGVIIGIIDTGVDYSHDDFLDSEGRSRILAIWDQSRNSGVGPEEILNTYGTECDSDSISNGSCVLGDIDGHGTHVAGIAASSDEKFRGVAPDANIIVVKYDARLDIESGYADTLFSTKICEAAYYVFAKAEQYGMPAVVNMSLGTHIGAHDGTSLFEECLGGLTSGAAGRALVAAAGNEYSGEWDYTGIHSGFEISDQPMATNFEIRNATSDGIYYVDVWGSAGGELSVEIAYNDKTSSDRVSSGFAAPDNIVSGSFLGGDIDYMINASETESVLNGKPHVGIRIYVDPALDVSRYSFDLVVKGSGSFDAWLFPDKPARTIQFTSMSGSQGNGLVYVSGDRVKSIAIPATSPNIIAVGGYATRTRWTVGSLTWIFNGQQLGELLNFSSSGPSADPSFTGHKPEIVAPGGMIASTKSSQAAVSSQVLMDDGEHFLQSGTSMAAPFVSGTIAMMFQHNPNFTHYDVRSIIIQSAYVDASVTAVPHDRWGNGKLDVLKAMEIAMTSEASGVFEANGSIVAPNASTVTGKSSCQLAISSNQAVCAIDMALLLAFLLCLVSGRKTLATPE
jgi:minor extracellular serine protease Vpr